MTSEEKVGMLEGELPLLERLGNLDVDITHAERRYGIALRKYKVVDFQGCKKKISNEIVELRKERAALWQLIAEMYPDIFRGEPYVPDEDPPSYKDVLRVAQLWLISRVIAELGYEPNAIPRGGVSKIEAICQLQHRKWFRTEQSFRNAWRVGRMERSDAFPNGRWQPARPEIYAGRKTRQ